MATELPALEPVATLSTQPRIIRILGGNPGKFTLQGTNTYLVGPAHSQTLIDTAQGEPAWRASLAAALPAQARISRILLTHWHPDHVLGLPDALAHPAAETATISKNQPAYLGHGPNARRLDALVATPAAKHSQWRHIRDADLFDADGYRLRALLTPGHAADHSCFVLEGRDGAVAGLFTGDNVLGHGTAVFEDLAAYMGTLRRILAELPAGGAPVPLYPGHGAVVADGRAKLEEYIGHREMRERQVLDTLGTEGGGRGLTGMGIVKVVYKDVPEQLHVPALGGVVQVLRKMQGEGRVVVSENAEGEEIWMVKEGGGRL